MLADASARLPAAFWPLSLDLPLTWFTNLRLCAVWPWACVFPHYGWSQRISSACHSLTALPYLQVFLINGYRSSVIFASLPPLLLIFHCHFFGNRKMASKRQKRRVRLHKVNDALYNVAEEFGVISDESSDKGIIFSAFKIFLRNYFLIGNKDDFKICCLQELKTGSISNQIKKVLDYYKLMFHFQPAVNRSGGLLTMWNKNEKSELVCSNESSIMTHFMNINLFVCDIYVKTSKYVVSIDDINDACGMIERDEDSIIILLGDCNVFENLKQDRKTLRLTTKIVKDHRIQMFSKFKSTLDKLLVEDIGYFKNMKDGSHKCEKPSLQSGLSTSAVKRRVSKTSRYI